MRLTYNRTWWPNIKITKPFFVFLMFTFSGLIIYLLFGIFWIGALLVLGSLGYFPLVLLGRKPASRFLAGILVFFRSFVVIVLIFLAGILSRLLLFEIYAIPSSSMEEALVPGDKIVVNKLAYGPGLPRSPLEIPWVNLFFYLAMGAGEEQEDSKWGYRRLQGLSEVAVGDVLVFNRKDGDNMPYIKRCMALPGEAFRITEGSRADFRDARWMKKTLIPVRIWTGDSEEMKARLDSLGVTVRRANQYREWDQVFAGRVPQHLVSHIRTWPVTDSLALMPEADGIRSNYLLSIDSSWTIYNFGPVLVPEKGMKVVLNDRTHAMYARVIRQYEGVEITREDGKFFAGGKEVWTYTFRHNYYFMMGDNREDSKDSRYYGFIPEHHIIGRADLILFSYAHGQFLWDRMIMSL